MNLDAIRTATRAQLDLDETDLPDTLLDLYVRDGYDRIINLERCWPFFEMLWTVTVPDTGQLPVPVDCREVSSVLGAQGPVMRIDSRHAENMFGLSTTGHGSAPMFWSQIGLTMYFWPQPSTTPNTYQLRGYRKPSDWIALGASAEVDADDRLHLPIVWYCCSVGYAQQEDEVLEQTYMNRFHESASLAHDDVMRAWTGAPKILNGASALASSSLRQPQLVFELPGP